MRCSGLETPGRAPGPALLGAMAEASVRGETAESRSGNARALLQNGFLRLRALSDLRFVIFQLVKKPQREAVSGPAQHLGS